VSAVVAHARPGRADQAESVVLLERYAEHRDPADLEEIVRRFRPLVRKLALRYARADEPLDDLEQIGSLGLIKAIHRFDPAKGFAFTSFAVPTIVGELRRSFRDTAWTAHVPRGTQERVALVRRASDAHATEHGRAPTVGELAAALDLDEELVVDALQAGASMFPLSLDGPGGARDGEDDPTALGDLLGEEDGGFGLVEDRVALRAAMQTLTPKQRHVIALRFDEGLKQSEIGQRLGCSQMQVSRLLRAALERLRTVAEHQSAAGV
jgi:RNA polymerase sigma-B factor